MASETKNDPAVVTDTERARRQAQSRLFDYRQGQWGTTHAVGWLLILAAVTAVLLGASLAFAN